uniref:Uncharacterized protein n=1 Tax=Panagrolaimus superbus TaxID=310955 RepID=A0A914Y468_9BILA
MQIWHMESYPIGDRRMPHHVFPPKMVTTDQLLNLAGVISYKVDLSDTLSMKKRLSYVRNEKDKVATDVLTLDENIMDLEEKLEFLYEPIEKEEDEVFMVLEGAMYYDVEHQDDKWVRIFLERGDLIIIPKGKPYRCTTTSTNFAKIQRFGTRSSANQG